MGVCGCRVVVLWLSRIALLCTCKAASMIDVVVRWHIELRFIVALLMVVFVSEPFASSRVHGVHDTEKYDVGNTTNGNTLMAHIGWLIRYDCASRRANTLSLTPVELLRYRQTLVNPPTDSQHPSSSICFTVEHPFVHHPTACNNKPIQLISRCALILYLQNSTT